MKSILLFALNILALLGAILWFISSPDYEPAITSLVLVATLVGLFVRKKKHQENVSINKTTENINNPSEIISSIKNRPPYQQQDARKYYIGLKVNWKGKLSNAHPEDKKRISVFLRSDEWRNVFVRFSVKQTDYPELKSMDENTEIKIQGTILDVGLSEITLENVKIV